MAKGFKTGGREQGTPNVLTREMRTILQEIIKKEIDLIPQVLENLEPEKRIELMLKLMPYVLPKIESINMNYNDFTNGINQKGFTIEWGDKKIDV